MPPGITILGLGPGRPELLTVEASNILSKASQVYVRTSRHPTVAALPPSLVVRSFDHIYESADTFDQVYDEICAQILELARDEQGVIYAVPGHPLFGEASVRRILARAAAEKVPVRIVEGLSFVEPACTRLGLDALDGVQLADALLLAAQHYPAVNPDQPLLISQVYSREVAADVKLALMAVYPDDHRVTLIKGAGTSEESLRSVPLYELDRCTEIDHLTSLYVPAMDKPGSVGAFQELVAHLRAPEGCPWDREQTHNSLRPYLLEETYEVLEALDNEDSAALCDELGDLLLQILLHTQIASEEGEFRMADVVAHVIAKLRRRHPHVFGQTQVADSDEVVVNWERIKGEEKNHRPPDQVLSQIPAGLPSLARAQSLQRRVARLGLDWPDVDHVWAKVAEEEQELRQATSSEQQSAELGDLLLAMVGVARLLGLDAESALREATQRFGQRFQAVWEQLVAEGMTANGLDAACFERLWAEAKKKCG